MTSRTGGLPTLPTPKSLLTDDETPLELRGRHCEIDGCRAWDLLPFVCSTCKLATCMEHRCKHDLPSVEAPECPRCHRVVELRSAKQLPSEALAAHVCGEERLVPQCCGRRGGRRCQEKVLLLSCAACEAAVCAYHRVPANHACPAAAAVPAKSCGRESDARKAAIMRGTRLLAK